jgi:NADPH-dependent 2,4-dienoyl-CoA reductase/sulfur reductase-like enzyme
VTAANRLWRPDEKASIIIVERSGHVSYANCGLHYNVGGVIEDEYDLLLQTPDRPSGRFRLEVRVSTEAENAQGGIPGSVNAPLDVLA